MTKKGLANSSTGIANRAFSVVSSTIDHTKSRISAVDPIRIALDAGTLIHDHPVQAGIYGAAAVMIAAPVLGAGPVLAIAGFGPEGVIAGMSS